MNKLKVGAECHSDDHAVEVSFDAIPFLKQAKSKNIIALAKCGWSGDYPADEVAIYMAGQNKDIADMFKYIEIRNRISDIGFECTMNEEDAMAWLKKNKPVIHSKILKENS
jgi:hypothetical protein